MAWAGQWLCVWQRTAAMCWRHRWWAPPPPERAMGRSNACLCPGRVNAPHNEEVKLSGCRWSRSAVSSPIVVWGMDCSTQKIYYRKLVDPHTNYNLPSDGVNYGHAQLPRTCIYRCTYLHFINAPSLMIRKIVSSLRNTEDVSDWRASLMRENRTGRISCYWRRRKLLQQNDWSHGWRIY